MMININKDIFMQDNLIKNFEIVIYSSSKYPIVVVDICLLLYEMYLIGLQ